MGGYHGDMITRDELRTDYRWILELLASGTDIPESHCCVYEQARGLWQSNHRYQLVGFNG